jgi:hypothetical protein
MQSVPPKRRFHRTKIGDVGAAHIEASVSQSARITAATTTIDSRAA